VKVRFVPLAKREVFETSRRYDAKLEGLGDRFLDELARMISLIKAHPEAWPVILEPDIRRTRLNRFPYGLVYRYATDEVVIFAVQHLKRRPNYWQRRLKHDGE
jgi:ParE toxin of type II toxin-antitoxin system, parDE